MNLTFPVFMPCNDQLVIHICWCMVSPSSYCSKQNIPLTESHFLQIAFTFVVYPSLILAYMGQAAYLSKHHVIESNYRIGFYVSVPGMF